MEDGDLSMRTGELSKTGFLGPDDQEANKPIHHIKGRRQFGTGVTKKGITAGNWGEEFAPVKRLYEGEVYEPPGRALAKMKIEERKRWRTPNGFVPSHPARKMTGSGTFDGAFGKIEYVPDGVYSKAPPKRTEIAKKGIYTRVGERGGFGYNTGLFSPNPEHVADTYEEDRVIRRKELEEHKRKTEGKKPFVAAGTFRSTFDSEEHSATGVGTLYKRDEACLPPKKDPLEGKTKKEIVEEKLRQRGFEKDFVPSHPPRKGKEGFLSKFPEHVPDMYDPSVTRLAMLPSRLAPSQRRKQGLPEKLASRPEFKPTRGSRTDFTRSIAKATIFRASPSLRNAGRRRQACRVELWM